MPVPEIDIRGVREIEVRIPPDISEAELRELRRCVGTILWMHACNDGVKHLPDGVVRGRAQREEGFNHLEAGIIPEAIRGLMVRGGKKLEIRIPEAA